MLETIDDAVQVAWGGSWRIPTEADFDELRNISNCTKVWTTVNGIKGHLFTSVRNNNTLFFPAGGYCGWGSVSQVGESGSYWSSSLDTRENIKNSRIMSSSSSRCTTIAGYRCAGYNVRGVAD